MAGKIWRYDGYDLRKFKPGEINYFVDIGANVGTTSIMAKILNPTARIIALEPSPQTYKILVANMKQWAPTGIECYNVALGDGEDMCLIPRKHSGMHRFCTENEKQWWPEEHAMTPSKTLAKIFEDYNIPLSDTFILKIDCEGGERFLLSGEQEEQALQIVRHSVQTMFEIHMPFGGTGKQWNSWFKKLSDTHELRFKTVEHSKENGTYKYIYIPCNEFIYEKGFKEVLLINRAWIGSDDGKHK